MPLGTSLFLWLRDNPTARWIVGIGAALIALLTWDKFRTERIKREANAKLTRKIEKAQEKHEEKIHEAEARTVERIDTDGLRNVASRDPANRGAVRLD